MSKACYRELKKYKYQLMDDYSLLTPFRPSEPLVFRFLSLDKNGLLTIRKAYAWDGASGPAIDTRTIMRGSLVHDALYQLIRLGALDYKVHREIADKLLRDICLEDGMSSFRAWYVYQGVRVFGEANARPRDEPEDQIVCVP